MARAPLGAVGYAHLRTWRPYTLWYVGLVGLAGNALAAARSAGSAGGRHPVGPALAAWAVPTLVWVAAHYLGDYLDRDLDAISKPQRPIPSGLIRPGTALGCGIVLALAAFGTAAATAGRTLLVLVGGIAGAVAYNGFFKSRGLWGNAVRGALTGAAFLFGELTVTARPPLALLPFIAVFCAHDTSSNLVGTLRDVDGDRAGGYVTFTVRHGLPIAGRTAAGLYAAALATAIAGVFIVSGHRPWYLAAVLVAAVLGGPAFRPLVAGPPPSQRVALRAHEVLVAERVVLAGALLTAGLSPPAALAITLPALAVTVTTQRAMRTRHEIAPPAPAPAGPVRPAASNTAEA
ncbi:MAG: UbiA family prenyltransferase [Catenulispora sp.]